MRSAFTKRIEVAANISIIIVAVLGAFVVAKGHILAKRPIAIRSEKDETV